MANKRTRRDGTKTVATLIYLDEKADAIASRIADSRGRPWTKTAVMRQILETALVAWKERK